MAYNEVDLNTIVNKFLEIKNENSDRLQKYGKPQIVFDALKMKIKDQPQWNLQRVENLNPQKAEYTAFQNDLYSEVVADTTSVLGNTFTITQGQVKGYNKKLRLTLPRELQGELHDQKHLEMYPGQTVTDNKDKLSLSLGSSHKMPQVSRSSKSSATVEIKEVHYKGTVTFQVRLKNDVLFLRGSGSGVGQMSIAQIVKDVKSLHSWRNNIQNVTVEHDNKGLPKFVVWTMTVNADIFLDFQESLSWS